MNINTFTIDTFPREKKVLEQGLLLMEGNKAKVLEIYDSGLNNFEIVVSGEVLDYISNPFLVSLVFREVDEEYFLVSGECTCSYDGNCKHMVSLAYEFAKNKGLNNKEEVTLVNDDGSEFKTSKSLSDLSEMFLGDLVEVDEEKEYDIIPNFEVIGKEILLRLTLRVLKTKKEYLIKDIYELWEMFFSEFRGIYGKNQEVNHRLVKFNHSEFLTEVLSLIEVSKRVLDRTRNRNSLNSWNNNSGAKNFKVEKRYLNISGEQMGALLEYFVGEDVVCTYNEFKKSEYRVNLGNVQPNLYIMKAVMGYDLSVEMLQEYLITRDSIIYFSLDTISIVRFNNKRSFEFLKRCLNSKLFISKVDSYNFKKVIIKEIEEDFNIKSEIAFEEDVEVCDIIVNIHGTKGGVSIKMHLDMEGNVDHVSYNQKSVFMLNSILKKYKKYNNTYYINDISEILDFIENKLGYIYKYADEVYVNDDFLKIKLRDEIDVSVSGNMVKGSIKISLLSTEFKEDELRDIFRAYIDQKEYYKLSTGEFIRLDSDKLKKIEEVITAMDLELEDFFEDKVLISKYRSIYLDKLLEEYHIDFQKDGKLKELLKDFKSYEELNFSLPKDVTGELRPYQLEGFKWLKFLEKYGFSGILADDMGLGKTLQVITLLSNIANKGPSLVITPASLNINWEKEIFKFNSKLKTLVYNGPKEEREKEIKEFAQYDVVITSYDILKRDIEELRFIEFYYCVLDEAQYIKNHRTQVAKCTKLINCKNKVALSGTPIENSLSELWSIFDFLMPGYLENYSKFKRKYEKPIIKDDDRWKLENLKKQVSPFILRRLKKDVLLELPEKTEQIIHVSLEETQRKIYDAQVLAFKEKLLSKSEDDIDRSKLEVLKMLMELRQICCNPRLISPNFPKESGKFEVLKELLKDLKAGGHKTIIFSQFTSNFPYIKELLKENEYSFLELTGQTNKNIRHELVERFNDSDIDVFLISLKAGGTGLNIIGADTVIHFDPWWNISAENQGTDRVHRIGQKNSVNVYKLIADNTIEAKIMEMQKLKKEMADAILENNVVDIKRMNKDDILDLLN